MKALVTVLGTFTLFLIVLSFGCAVGAYPTKWVVNYLFSSSALHTVFGVTRFDFWHALALDFLAGCLFKSSVSSSSKK